MRADGRLVESVDGYREMIDVPALGTRCRASRCAERSVDRDEVDERPARAQLEQADLRLGAFVGASDDVAVESQHPIEIRDAQDDMIDPDQGERRTLHGRRLPRFSRSSLDYTALHTPS